MSATVKAPNGNRTRVYDVCNDGGDLCLPVNSAARCIVSGSVLYSVWTDLVEQLLTILGGWAHFTREAVLPGLEMIDALEIEF